MSNEDEGRATLEYPLDCKMVKGLLYTPTSGPTHIMPRFKKDIGALLALTRSEPPLLRIVHSSMSGVGVFWL